MPRPLIRAFGPGSGSFSVLTTDRAMLASPLAFGCSGKAGSVGTSPSNQRVGGSLQTSWPMLSS